MKKMKNNDNKGFNLVFCTVLAIVFLSAAFCPASAWDFSTTEIPANNVMTLSTLNGGSYFVGFRCEGGGLNALHITTSTSSPYGTLTRTSTDSGTFYLADTGGRGYFDRAILMVAIQNPEGDSEIRDDFKINIKVNGYSWASTGVKDAPPEASAITYRVNSLNRDFPLSSFNYGPQNWKPAGDLDYPIMPGQSSSDEFYIFFVDTGVGILGKNSGITGLTDNGMAKVEYSIENYNGETVVFNVYGYALNADAFIAYDAPNGAIAWTNKVGSGDSYHEIGTTISGYIVNTDLYSGGSGEFGDSNSTANQGNSVSTINYGSSMGSSPELKDTWVPAFGNLNVTSNPAEARLFIDGVETEWSTNCSIEDYPTGTYSIYLAKDEYENTDEESITIKKGFVTTEHFDLTPAGASCRFESVPSGADIYIDGADTLWHTNSTLEDIPSGEHTIRMEKDDYPPVSLNITLSVHETPCIVADFSNGSTSYCNSSNALGDEYIESKEFLEPAALYITSYPEDLAITLDGGKTDFYTPHLFYGLKAGWHKVKLSRESSVSGQASGALQLSSKVYLPPGEVTVERLSATDQKKDTPVTIDSKKLGDTEFLVSGKLPAYTVPSKVSVNKFMDYITYRMGDRYYSKTLTGNYQGKSYELDDSGIFGKIEFTSTPEGAEIFIDGYDSGLQTPTAIGDISEGTHNIRIVKDGYYPFSEEITVVDTNQDIDYTVKAVLQDYSYGKLFINSTPQGSKIYLRGEFTGVSTPYEFDYIPIGTYYVGLLYNRSLYKKTVCTVIPEEKSDMITVDEILTEH